MAANSLEITDNDILDIEPQRVALVPQRPEPMQMVALAIERNWDLERLSKLLDLQERWRANEARNAFEEAMAAFKAESIVILKDKTNNQYQSKYVSLGNLVATVTPYLSKHGLSASWDVEQSSGIRVTCIITHKLGHSKSCSVSFPPDKSGAKNPIQEIKSAITYAKACTFESVCGLASTDANLDDDGNGAGQRSVSGLTEDAVNDFVDNIKQAGDLDELQTRFAEAYKAAGKDTQLRQVFIKAKDQRKAQLR